MMEMVVVVDDTRLSLTKLSKNKMMLELTLLDLV